MTDSTQVIQIAKEAAKHAEPSLLMLCACLALGMAVHFVLKAKRLQKDANFNAKDFWKTESLSIILSVLVSAFALICKENIAQLNAAGYLLGNFMYPTFFGIGYLGDSLIDKVMGGYEKKLEKLSS